jgi:sodium/proline symporter
MSVFLLGLSQAWIAVGLIAGMYLNWQFVAPRLRSMTEGYNCYTLSSFFEKRFQDDSGMIRSISAIILVLFLTHYLSAGMIGIGILLESVFGLNYYFGLSFALCIVVVYTFFGGFVAVAWTDLFQGIFLLFAIILVPTLAFQQLDGIQEVFTIAQTQGINLSILPNRDPVSIVAMGLLAISWGLGYFGMPHVITKFMSIKNTSELKKSKWVGMGWQVIVLLAAIWVGFISIAFFVDGISNPQMVFVDMVKIIFHPLIAGFILCAILAASMSTMDSQILVCASVLSEDLYPSVCKNPTPESKLRLSRLSIIGVALVAMLLSFNKSTTIMDTVSYSWAGLGSAFGPLVLSSLYAKRINRYGAIAGILAGSSVVMIWPYLNPFISDYSLPAMIPGFFSSLFCIYAISYLSWENVESIGERLVKN